MSAENVQSGIMGSVELQEVIDSILGCDDFLKSEVSVTVADPTHPDCILVACSDGFTRLTGYSLGEIIGKNCRFLLSGVPEEYIDPTTRQKCRQFIKECRDKQGLDENVASSGKEQRSKSELCCVQANATKSGELFRNMFYLRQVQLQDKPFILGFQAALPEDWEDDIAPDVLESYCQEAFDRLGRNMSAVEQVLAQYFWYSASMRRQGDVKTVAAPIDIQMHLGNTEVPTMSGQVRKQKISESFDGFVAPITETKEEEKKVGFSIKKAPSELHTMFPASEVQKWESSRFTMVRRIELANRNQGSVCLMRDQLNGGRFIAAKQMPKTWVKTSHEEFIKARPRETERPWTDIGCNRFLDSVGYPYSIGLIGVFADDTNINVVTSFAARGDLFAWASDLSETPGPAREKAVRSIANQLGTGMKLLHDMSIVHCDLSVENVLLTSNSEVKIIDFGASVTTRHNHYKRKGKPSYIPPEVYGSEPHDGFLSDAFAFGVVLYAIGLMDYPWLSCEGPGDKCVQYIRQKGFQAFTTKKKLPRCTGGISDFMSANFTQLLAGVFEFDPAKRLTLGESCYEEGRRSIWDEPWMKEP